MAVEYVTELWPGRYGEDGIDRKRSYPRFFEVRTTDQNDDATVVGGDARLPRNGSRHPNDFSEFMVRIRPEQHSDDATLWAVTCEYSTDIPRVQGREAQTLTESGESEPNAQAPGDRPENPLDRPVTWKVGYEQSTEVVRETRFGAAVCNGAKDPFDPPLQAERSCPVVTLSRNVGGVNFANLNEYQDAVNLDTWKGFAPGLCKIGSIEYEPAHENGVSFVKFSCRIKIKWDGWQPKLVDQGFYELIQTGTDPETSAPIYEKKRIRDPKTGEVLSDPSLLDGNGMKLAAGLDPVLLTFQVLRQKNFAPLGL